MKGPTIKSSGPGASASRPCAPELWSSLGEGDGLLNP